MKMYVHVIIAPAIVPANVPANAIKTFTFLKINSIHADLEVFKDR